MTVTTKKASKAEVARNQTAKAHALANTKAIEVTWETAYDNVVKGVGSELGAARILGAKLNEEFAAEMAAFQCHWSSFTTANCRTDNEKAILARIEGHRKAIQAIAEARLGTDARDIPWSRAKAASKELFGIKRLEATPKPLESRIKETLIKLGKAGRKEERPTESEFTLCSEIERLLVTYFKYDTSQLG